MIDAAEAYKLTLDINTERAQSQLKEIEKEIIRNAEEGRSSCSVDFWPLPSVIDNLEKLGYYVKEDSGMNESWTTIRWDK